MSDVVIDILDDIKKESKSIKSKLDWIYFLLIIIYLRLVYYIHIESK